jgi:hypothetical protein
MTCCTGNCNQGRDCDQSRQMTMTVLHRVMGLQQDNGGHKVDTDRCTDCPGYCPSGDYCHQQELPYSEPMSFAALIALGTLAVACLGAAAYIGFPLN